MIAKAIGTRSRPSRVNRSRRQEDAEYQLLFEDNPHPMWVYDSETLGFLAVNDAAVRHYGYSRDEFLTITLKDIRPAEDVPALLENVSRAAQGRDEAGIWRHRKKDGTIFYVEVTSHSLIFGGRRARLVLANDVTLRQQAEKALRQAKLVVENSPAVLFRWRAAEGWPVELVSENVRQFGYTPEELLTGATPYASMVHPEDLSRVAGEVAEHSASGKESFQQIYRLNTKDGRIRWVDDRTSLERDAAGRVTHYQGIVIDITEQKRAEENQRNLEEQMRHVQKLESLGVLAGGIAHDFNNLLMAILGNADLATLQLPPESPVRDNLEEILRASHQAADLCRRMLAYSGKGRFVLEKLDLSVAVREMTHILQVSISKKALLRYEFPERLPAVEVDATQLRQVIMNLITNASEALGDRSGVISVRTGVQECDHAYLTGSVLGSDAAEGSYVFLEVSDNGCGMDAQTQERIFDPFFSTKFTGRGLGLAAVLGIVHGHKGVLKVYSEPGKGSTFKVLLPATADEAPAAGSLDLSTRAWRGSGTLLLVDDEEMIRTTTGKMLERLGFHVLTAKDGREAVDIFRVEAESIVCVLLDLTMPRMSGEEALRELRRIRPDARVILSSGYNQQDITQRFVGRGLAGFIQKPYTVAQLQKVLRSVLG